MRWRIVTSVSSNLISITRYKHFINIISLKYKLSIDINIDKYQVAKT
jgi:hypothetical protein